MAKIGYIRVSTADQNTARQEALLKDITDKLFIEKVSGISSNRPELRKMMEYIREGDTVIVESFSRISRNTVHLINLVQEFTDKGVEFVSLKENIDTKTPQGHFALTLFGAFAQLERETNKERQMEGIAAAKSRGVYKGRPPIQVDEKIFQDVYTRWQNGDIKAVEAMKILGLKPGTFYRRVKKLQEDE